MTSFRDARVLQFLFTYRDCDYPCHEIFPKCRSSDISLIPPMLSDPWITHYDSEKRGKKKLLKLKIVEIRVRKHECLTILIGKCT